jgi:hypothetical protein
MSAFDPKQTLAWKSESFSTAGNAFLDRRDPKIFYHIMLTTRDSG